MQAAAAADAAAAIAPAQIDFVAEEAAVPEKIADSMWTLARNSVCRFKNVFTQKQTCTKS